MHDGHAALVGGGAEPGEIADYTSAERDDVIGAGHAGSHKLAPHALGAREGLVGLSGLNRDRAGNIPQAVGVKCRHGLVADEERSGSRTVHRPGLGEPGVLAAAQQPATDEHGVGPGRRARPQQHGVGQLAHTAHADRRAAPRTPRNRVRVGARAPSGEGRTRSQATTGSTSSSNVRCSASATRTRLRQDATAAERDRVTRAGVGQQLAYQLLLARTEGQPRRGSRTRARSSGPGAVRAARHCRGPVRRGSRQAGRRRWTCRRP